MPQNGFNTVTGRRSPDPRDITATSYCVGETINSSLLEFVIKNNKIYIKTLYLWRYSLPLFPKKRSDRSVSDFPSCYATDPHHSYPIVVSVTALPLVVVPRPAWPGVQHARSRVVELKFVVLRSFAQPQRR